jgi:hypothetical protein
MMKKIIAVVLMLALLLAPLPVSAHDTDWHPGPMKQDQIASPAIECRAVGSYQGHTHGWSYRMVGNGSDERERPWLESFCDYAGRAHVKGKFMHDENPGIEIPDSAITITFKHLR